MNSFNEKNISHEEVENLIFAFLKQINPFDDDILTFHHSVLPLKNLLLPITHSINSDVFLMKITDCLEEHYETLLPEGVLVNSKRVEKGNLCFSVYLDPIKKILHKQNELIENEREVSKKLLEEIAIRASYVTSKISMDAEDYVRSCFLQAIKRDEITHSHIKIYKKMKYKAVEQMIEEFLNVDSISWNEEEFIFLKENRNSFFLLLDDKSKETMFKEKLENIKI